MSKRVNSVTNDLLKVDVKVKSIRREAVTSAWPLKPLDEDFDDAIVALAEDVLPGGFDVADEAPSTFEALRDHLNGGQRMVVWSGASGLTIYGSPEVNYAFRAWHDHYHYVDQQPFTLAGEAAVAWRQVEHLRERFGNHPRLRLWCAYVYAEVLRQALRADMNHGVFPANQRLFVKAFVETLINEEANTGLIAVTLLV